MASLVIPSLPGPPRPGRNEWQISSADLFLYLRRLSTRSGLFTDSACVGSTQRARPSYDLVISSKGVAMGTDGLYHNQLPCGADLAGQYMPRRRVVAINITFLAGSAAEPADQLGVAQLDRRPPGQGHAALHGRADWPIPSTPSAPDATARRAARRSVSAAWHWRTSSSESWNCTPRCSPGPTFPADQCNIARNLSLQELAAIEDDPMDVLHKMARRQALGPVLGRHPLGERETLERIGRTHIVDYWRENLTGRQDADHRRRPDRAAAGSRRRRTLLLPHQRRCAGTSRGDPAGS